MLIAVLSVATVLAAVWLVFMSMVTRDDWIAAAYNKVLDNLTAIDKLRLKDKAKQESSKRHELIRTAAPATSITVSKDNDSVITKTGELCELYW